MTNFLADPTPTIAEPPPRSRLAAAMFWLGLLGIPLILLGVGLYFYGWLEDALISVIGGSLTAIGLLGLFASCAARRYQRTHSPSQLNPNSAWLLLAAMFLPAIACGGLSVGLNFFIAGVMPITHPLAVIAPVFVVLVGVGIGLPMMTRLRAWGYLLGGAWIAPILSLVFEIAVFVVVLVGGFGLALIVPQAFGGLDQFVTALQVDPNLDPLELFSEAELFAILGSPGVLFGIWLVVGVAAPLLEEAFKPIGVYLAILFKRPLTVRMAFIGGLLGGIGFNITESLFNAASVDIGWPFVMVIRIGTLLMHAASSGLVGWGVGMAVVKSKWLFAGVGYLLGVFIHGLWNTMVIVIVAGALNMVTFSGLEIVPTTDPTTLLGGSLLMLIGFGGLLSLIGINIALLAYFAYRFRGQALRSARLPNPELDSPPDETIQPALS